MSVNSAQVMDSHRLINLLFAQATARYMEGGSDSMKVTLTYDSETSSWSADKTYEEIKTAVDNGQLVYAVSTDDEDYTTVYQLREIDSSEESENKYYGFYSFDLGDYNPDQSPAYLTLIGIYYSILDDDTIVTETVSVNVTIYSE